MLRLFDESSWMRNDVLVYDCQLKLKLLVTTVSHQDRLCQTGS